MLDHGQKELVHDVDGKWRTRAAEIPEPPRVCLLDEAGEFPAHVRIKAAQRLSEARLTRGIQIEVPLRELDEAIDPASPIQVAKRLGLQHAKALDETSRQRLVVNARALEQAGDHGVDLARRYRLHQ